MVLADKRGGEYLGESRAIREGGPNSGLVDSPANLIGDVAPVSFMTEPGICSCTCSDLIPPPGSFSRLFSHQNLSFPAKSFRCSGGAGASSRNLFIKVDITDSPLILASKFIAPLHTQFVRTS